ncbi:hypothetical protein [Streptomyces ipomoeae]|uniref:hypothetical protein n=1 Tax=Streptomyces ipomoeae TaxID=103232 RepID=UPI0035A57B0B
MDLLDWHRGRLSSRRLSVLVKYLPRDSATLQELHGEAANWSVTDYLLANVVDQLSEANWMFATVNRDEDAEPLEYPRPVPRPGTETGTETGTEAGTGMEETGPPYTGAGSPSSSTGASGASSSAPSPSSADAPARNPSAIELARFFS